MSVSFQRKLRSVVRTLIAMRASGMNWSDLHEGNVMQDAKGRWKLIDLGRSKWDSAEVPVLK
jgi:predicted unusual protein kinase regulating ubiquinone biosynthesis (AarF/ABC1/UbiB family)